VYSARRWTAPKLELAADHVTKTVAPSVSSALRSTAKQVKPAEPKGRTALTWSLLGAAILATAGAAFALLRYQFRAATPDDAVEVGETTDVPARPAPATSTGPATPAQASGATRTSASGTSGTSGSGTSGTSNSGGASASAAKTAPSRTAGKTAADKTVTDKTVTDRSPADKAPTTTDTSVNGHVTSSGW
jgi:hypothetical protein